MENEKKISNIYIYLIMIYYNLTLSSICFSSFIMNDFKKIAWMIPLFSIIPVILLFFLYKPINLIDLTKTSLLFKIILLINSVFHNVLLIYISSHMMGISFFSLSPVSLFAVSTIIVTCFLSFLDFKKIIRLATILITGLIWFIPFIFDFEYNNNPNMELFGKIDFSILRGIYFTTVCNDLIIYALYNKEYKKPISRKAYIIVSSIILIASALQIVDSYTLVSYRYYEDIEMPSLIRYFSHQGKRFFEHFDILLLFLTLTTTFYKVSFNVICLKDTLFNKYKNRFIIFYFLILTPIVFFVILNQHFFKNIVMIVSITTLIVFIFISTMSRWRNKKCIKKSLES